MGNRAALSLPRSQSIGLLSILIASLFPRLGCAKSSWSVGGYDWVVLTLIVAFPVWAPSKVFALPIAMRRYRNRQGLTKGKKSPKGKRGQKKSTKPKHDPYHRTRPELALELIIMVARWFPNGFPNDEIIMDGYG